MSVVVLLGVVVILALAASAAASRRRGRIARERRELERSVDRIKEGARVGAVGADTPPSAFLDPGFGSFLDDVLQGAGPGDASAGSWSRSYVWDSRTGQWLDVTNGMPGKPVEHGPAAGHAGSPSPSRPASGGSQRRDTRPARRPALFGALADLLDDGTGEFNVERPEDLPTFADVGGMDELKQEIRDTVGLLLQHPADAAWYGIEWNGILLHGPPGVGKTFLARAIAGEFRLNLIHVSTGDLVSSLVGASARNIEKAFEAARQHLPCLLFFDEFDSVAQRREDAPDAEARRTVNQLLTSLETGRDERRLLVMAATNSIEELDPAVIRPGRFDRHIRIDLPDAEARRAIFRAELDDRPTAKDIQLDELVRRTEGMTPAAIVRIVDIAALEVFREATRTGRHLEVRTEHLLAALERYGGEDRPTVEHWTWDSLVLPPEIKAQLQQLQAVIEDPEQARRFGVEPPTGLLLAGPPGTGKTTIAKVLAAQARCSFYPISGADVMSKWVGESERNIRHLFERARANRPSIVFIDEIDAIAGRRGEIATPDSQVNQLLAEIDGITGQPGLFVIGATNRPDQLDPALLRGGRLSRTIVLGLPDEAGRLAILRMYTARMPTVAVRLEELAKETEGLSPADLRALCQEAALAAMARLGGSQGSAVTHADFEEALHRLRNG